VATEGKEMNIYQESLYMWAKVSQVRDMAHGPLVILEKSFYDIWNHNKVICDVITKENDFKITRQCHFMFYQLQFYHVIIANLYPSEI
jgi:hypothetical protein